MNENQTYDDLLDQVAVLQSRVKDLELSLKLNQQKNDRLKRRFLSSVSHELRTPMNAILGFSSLMIDRNLSEIKREEYMEYINSNGNDLLKLVDSMIDASLLEVDDLPINKKIVDLNEVIQQVYSYSNIDKYKMGKDHIALLLNREVKHDEFLIYTDPARLTQVLSNLLKNAFKFTQKGVVEFGYEVNEESEKLQFYVKDSGKGVLFEKAHIIFEKFEKLDEGVGVIGGGLGLGLTLARGLVKLLGGDIWFESNVFKGTSFYFNINYKKTLRTEQEDNQSKINLQSIFV